MHFFVYVFCHVENNLKMMKYIFRKNASCSIISVSYVVRKSIRKDVVNDTVIEFRVSL